ncbi:MAG: helix-turn-helix domain-containing protein [Hyphomonadaceae bacterium]
MHLRYETRHEAGAEIAPHRHEHAYAALVLSGAYEEAGPDGVWACGEGALILHPPFHLHLNRFAAGAARVLNFTLPHDLARALGAHDYGVFQLRDPSRVAGCTHARDAIDEALDQSEALPRANTGSWLDALAEALAAERPPSVAALARRTGVTPEHAARAFRKRFGMSPAAFRGEHRVRRALAGLADGRRSLSDIAQDVGFSDQAHFCRGLRQATGRSPSALRALLS